MPLPENWYVKDGILADVSEVGSINFLVPTAGILRRVETSLGAAITVADAIITVSKNAVALSPTITIAQSGSAVGTVDFADFYVQVAKGDQITVASGGESTTASQLAINVIFSG
jgi:hypothetical protein